MVMEYGEAKEFAAKNGIADLTEDEYQANWVQHGKLPPRLLVNRVKNQRGPAWSPPPGHDAKDERLYAIGSREYTSRDYGVTFDSTEQVWVCFYDAQTKEFTESKCWGKFPGKFGKEGKITFGRNPEKTNNWSVRAAQMNSNSLKWDLLPWEPLSNYVGNKAFKTVAVYGQVRYASAIGNFDLPDANGNPAPWAVDRSITPTITLGVGHKGLTANVNFGPYKNGETLSSAPDVWTSANFPDAGTLKETYKGEWIGIVGNIGEVKESGDWEGRPQYKAKLNAYAVYFFDEPPEKAPAATETAPGGHGSATTGVGLGVTKAATGSAPMTPYGLCQFVKGADEGAGVSLEQLEQVSGPNVDTLVDKLIAEGFLYEPSLGKVRVISVPSQGMTFDNLGSAPSETPSTPAMPNPADVIQKMADIKANIAKALKIDATLTTEQLKHASVIPSEVDDVTAQALLADAKAMMAVLNG